MQRLKVTVSPSLKQALEKQLQQMSLQQNSTGNAYNILGQALYRNDPKFLDR